MLRTTPTHRPSVRLQLTDLLSAVETLTRIWKRQAPEQNTPQWSVETLAAFCFIKLDYFHPTPSRFPRCYGPTTSVHGPRVWNSLLVDLRSADISLHTFRNRLKAHFVQWTLTYSVANLLPIANFALCKWLCNYYYYYYLYVHFDPTRRVCSSEYIDLLVMIHTVVLQPLCTSMSTCVSRHILLTAGGFVGAKLVLLPIAPC